MLVLALRDATALRIVTVVELAVIAVHPAEAANKLSHLLLLKLAVIQGGGFEGEGLVNVEVLRHDGAVVTNEGRIAGQFHLLQVVKVAAHVLLVIVGGLALFIVEQA